MYSNPNRNTQRMFYWVHTLTQHKKKKKCSKIYFVATAPDMALYRFVLDLLFTSLQIHYQTVSSTVFGLLYHSPICIKFGHSHHSP